METVKLRSLEKMLSKKYRHRHLIACEVSGVAGQYTSLKPVVDTYVFNDGSSRRLMCLTGTIPVCHKGMEHEIPVSLWLPESYPLHPPMCYVQPTKNATVVRSENVDADGKVDFPYLQTWKPPLTDLHGLVQVMRVMFEESLPLCEQDHTRAGPETSDSFADGFLSLSETQTQTEAHWSAEGRSKVILCREDSYPCNESKC